MNIKGTYFFTISESEDGGYIATGREPSGKCRIITQGENENEIFDMIADAYKCALEIEVPDTLDKETGAVV